ncbi:unnamed protein product [Urochloa humidicola]
MEVEDKAVAAMPGPWENCCLISVRQNAPMDAGGVCPQQLQRGLQWHRLAVVCSLQNPLLPPSCDASFVMIK